MGLDLGPGAAAGAFAVDGGGVRDVDIGRITVSTPRLRQRALGPRRRTRIVAGAKGQAAELLVQIRTLDRISVLAQPLDAGVEARPGALAIACFPMQGADLALQAGNTGCVLRRLELRAHGLVMRQAIGPTPGQHPQIAQPLAHGADLVVTEQTAGERGERPFVVADGVVVAYTARARSPAAVR